MILNKAAHVPYVNTYHNKKYLAPQSGRHLLIGNVRFWLQNGSDLPHMGVIRNPGFFRSDLRTSYTEI